jgi:hypothetical protein
MDTLRILAELHGERERIDQAIEALESLNGSTSKPKTFKTATKTTKPVVVKREKTAPVASPATKKRVISPEGRQRMAEAQQKRWAKRKKAVNAAKKAVAAA